MAPIASVRGFETSGSTTSPAQQITGLLPYQSYFDSTAFEAALRLQPQGQAIIGAQVSNIAGYALGLHPSSQTPVAVRMKQGKAGSNNVLCLKPGEVIHPTGGPDGGFAGFEYGLPSGWLGGGAFNLHVFQSPHAHVAWLDRTELIFHRIRQPIINLASVPAANGLTYNWPNRFPWTQAKRYDALLGSVFPQASSTPTLSVTPTRVLFSVRGDVPVGAVMRVYAVGTDDFANETNPNVTPGLTSLVDAVAYDVALPSWTSAASANYATQYPIVELPSQLVRLAGNSGSLIFVDANASGIAGLNIDIVRYGTL
jgi:hypothetical protein